MKTLSFKHPVFQYLLDCIDPDYFYEINGKNPANDTEKLKYVIDTFKAEKSWNIKQVGEFEAFKDWLMGLPSVINIDYENYKILEIAYLWGSIDQNLTGKAKEKREDLILENWFAWITAKFFRLCKKHKINF